MQLEYPAAYTRSTSAGQSRLALCSLDSLCKAVAAFRPDVVVSIFSRRYPAPSLPHVSQERLCFHDIEQPTLGAFGPQPAHVRHFLDVLAARPECMLIQCHRGLSRSPAFAVVALVHSGLSPSDACQRVRQAVPHASPNRWLIRLADAALGLDGALKQAVASSFAFNRNRVGPIGPAAGFVRIER